MMRERGRDKRGRGEEEAEEGKLHQERKRCVRHSTVNTIHRRKSRMRA